MRSLGIMSGLILSLLAYEFARAAPLALSPAETKVCKNIRQCIDILDRHSPEEFDYAILHQQFMRLGPKGVSILLHMLASQDEVAQFKAQKLLSIGNIKYSPNDQAKIAALWPRGDLDAHAKIMRANLSPAILSRAIETLGHKDEDVRRLSRDLIDALPENSHRLNAADFNRLAKAVITEPRPGLVSLLKTEPSEKTKPVLTRILRSGDAASVIAAYEALFAQDPKTAFQTLLGTLYDLTDDEDQAALGLAALLRHRHKSRADGFYLNFAKDIANDSKMSAMGRLVGFDAVMGFGAQNKTRLANTPLMIENLKAALAAHADVPLNYAHNFYASANDNAQPWIDEIWRTLKSDPYKNPNTATIFFRYVGTLSTPGAKSIVSQALNNKRDYGMIILGLTTAVRQKDKSRIAQFKKLLSHPISDVRAVSAAAIDALQQGTISLSAERLSDRIAEINRDAKLCRAVPTDFKAEVKQLPFFDLETHAINSKAPLRSLVSSIAPTSEGWLVGYIAGQAGGDLQFYDNKTGRGVPVMYAQNTSSKTLSHSNVQAILPVTPQPLGQYASEFWSVITDGHRSGHSAIYRVSKNRNRFRLKRHAQLPSNTVQLSQQPNADIFISFYEAHDKTKAVHPPLILSKNGALRRACEGASADPLKALP